MHNFENLNNFYTVFYFIGQATKLTDLLGQMPQENFKRAAYNNKKPQCSPSVLALIIYKREGSLRAK